MDISKDELISVLSQFNPWWRNEIIPDLPEWRRVYFDELYNWTHRPPAPRAVFLSGARQVGKTTLLLQVIDALIKHGVVPTANILYATFDHPLVKMAGIDAVLEAWREREPKLEGPEYIFLDEAQFMRDWAIWIKHQVDFVKNRRIVFTGSAMPLITKGQESGVGRWYTIKLTTLSFYEYLRLKENQSSIRYLRLKNFFTPEFKNFRSQPTQSINYSKIPSNLLEKKNKNSKHYSNEQNSSITREIDQIVTKSFLKSLEPLPELPTLNSFESLETLFDWSPQEFHRVAEQAEPYVGHFHQYLVRGGFPQTAGVESINQAQRLLREDIIDKVLKRDMTALFGVRRVLELEQTFLYLCMHDGGLLNMQQLCSNLNLKRPTAQNFIDLLEATHLIYRLEPFGYGKEILRAKFKIYLADPAIASAVLLKGTSILDNPSKLGNAIETAVFKHLFARPYQENIRFTYWNGKNNHEVDLIAETETKKIPFEIKYRTQNTGLPELKGLLEFCNKEPVQYGYVITKSLKDFGIFDTKGLTDARIMKIPAPLLCYWMSNSQLPQADSLE